LLSLTLSPLSSSVFIDRFYFFNSKLAFEFVFDLDESELLLSEAVPLISSSKLIFNVLHGSLYAQVILFGGLMFSGYTRLFYFSVFCDF
jgi:hypothetical protein